jgi:hypothetical protein
MDVKVNSRVALKPTAVPRPMGSKTDRAGFRKTASGSVSAGIYVVMMSTLLSAILLAVDEG